MELVLRVNLGPLDVLKGLINEFLASDPDRSTMDNTIQYHGGHPIKGVMSSPYTGVPNS